MKGSDGCFCSLGLPQTHNKPFHTLSVVIGFPFKLFSGDTPPELVAQKPYHFHVVKLIRNTMNDHKIDLLTLIENLYFRAERNISSAYQNSKMNTQMKTA